MAPFVRALMVTVCACSVLSVNAQVADTSGNAKTDTIPRRIDWNRPPVRTPFPTKSLIVPAVMVAYGIGSLASDGLKSLNSKVKEEVYTEHPHKPVKIDNYLIFVPAAAVYGLNAMGIHGKNNFRDRTLIYTMSNLIMSGLVFGTKNISGIERPDQSDRSSFPSGHTAAAFVAAEFMRQEYKDVSPWYGVAGYTIAATTGYLRMYNNKHWLSDVVAGAGIGIASTKLAYWLYPKITRGLFKEKNPQTVIMPTYQQGSFGIGLVHKFK
jgi:hypothetical protein